VCKTNRGDELKTAKHSKYDTEGKLYVDCAECERGGNGSAQDKCSCGWHMMRGGNGGCYLGTILASLTPPKSLDSQACETV
jgi:hypothetical protein